jgi:hypothetical protein
MPKKGVCNMAIILIRVNNPEEDARIKAEKERLKRLKITDPERYKKETSVRRKFLWFVGILCAVIVGLLVVLVLASK